MKERHPALKILELRPEIFQQVRDHLINLMEQNFASFLMQRNIAFCSVCESSLVIAKLVMLFFLYFLSTKLTLMVALFLFAESCFTKFI